MMDQPSGSLLPARGVAHRGPSLPEQNRREERSVLDLVRVLCSRLREARITYCHWKSNEAISRSASGDNDLDLLVRRADFSRFLGLLHELGFKEARPPAVRELPGVLHYYGLDFASGRFVHVHTQAQLVLGDDMTKNYRLPIEDTYLASVEQGELFALPSPDVELAVFTLRMVLKHATWDAIAYGRGRLGGSERRELAWLEDRADPGAVRRIVAEALPGIGSDLFDDCRACLHPTATLAHRVATARRLRAVLAGNARYSPAHDTALRIWRRASWGGRRYVLGRRTKKQLVSGGALIALVGGDGSGKTTAVEALTATLGRTFPTTQAHLGKPRRSAATLAVKGPMYLMREAGLFASTRTPSWEAPARAGNAPSYAWLVWHVLNARDRDREHSRARRRVGAGELVICDRYPLPGLTYMDGARTVGLGDVSGLPWLARWLILRERAFYARIGAPDVLVVLRVDPEIAVRRRVDEPEHFVRVRNQQVFEMDWSATGAQVIDAAQPQEEVLSQVLRAVWSRL